MSGRAAPPHSEIEGKTPVYYRDEACTKLYRKAYRYCPLMLLAFEAKRAQDAGAVGGMAFENAYVNADADGYRLPKVEEHRAATAVPSRAKYSWGSDVKDVAKHAWMFGTSGGTTHPVGKLKPNSLGVYDVEGNVSELGGLKKDGRAPFRLGGSFLDLTVGQKPEPPFLPKGWGYPDIGFRVVRQIPRRRAATREAPSAIDTAVLAQPRTASRSKQPAIDPAKYDPLRGKVYRGSLLRDGVFDAKELRSLKGLKWRFATEGPVRSSPVVVDGLVYVGSNDGHVFAIDAAKGTLAWKVKTGDKVTGSAAVVDAVVFIASEDGHLYALDARTGQQKWKALLGRDKKPAGSPAVAYGLVFMPTGNRGGSESDLMVNGPIVGLDITTGEKVWEASGGSQGYCSPAIVGGEMVTTGQQSALSIDLQTRQTMWRIGIAAQSRDFIAPAVSAGRAFVASPLIGNVSAFSLQTRRQLWQSFTLEGQLPLRYDGEPGHEIFGAPAVAHGRVYVGCNDHKLHTFGARNGARGWTFTTEGPVQSAPAIAGKVVCFGSWDGHLYALDAVSGKQLWKFKTDGRVNSSPWPADGTVYFGSDDGNVYAIE